MLKKYLYHGSFALLGVSLLLGMAILQAEGLKNSNNGADIAEDESNTAAPIDTAPSAGPATTNAPEEVQVAELPAPAPVSRVLPETMTAPVARIVQAPVKSAPDVIKEIPLDNVQ